MNNNELNYWKEKRNHLISLNNSLTNKNVVSQNRRVIDTFPAQHIKESESFPAPLDSLSEYSTRKNYGLSLRRRRKNRHNIRM